MPNKMVRTLALMSVALLLPACGTVQNAANHIGNAAGSAAGSVAGFVNQAVDSLPTPNALHQGATTPANPRLSAMGRNNQGVPNQVGPLSYGTLGGNSTIQVDSRAKTVTIVYTARTSTSSVSAQDAASGLRYPRSQPDNQRLSSMSLPLGWTLHAKMRMNAGAGTRGTDATLAITSYQGQTVHSQHNQASQNHAVQNRTHGIPGVTRSGVGPQYTISFAARQQGTYAVVMNHVGMAPIVMTVVAVTPTIDLPVISFPA
ncbi:hypothetical protein [Alicyclobacillus ferrooxydans]|uniref:Uncharacterized protein n=1 Tax=Alicyclobacillus ferrooxydans TaxID=471514 RepID=A0A0P9CDL9_9BACL|nr:hypothetical protein [Alicyclobacillus ferrooxydans]KPV43710.1 hypothetical protein AN477_11170 [Alicyclobacillus ferrooxydans]